MKITVSFPQGATALRDGIPHSVHELVIDAVGATPAVDTMTPRGGSGWNLVIYNHLQFAVESVSDKIKQRLAELGTEFSIE